MWIPLPPSAERELEHAGPAGLHGALLIADAAVYWPRGPLDRLVVGERLVVPGVRVARVGQLAF